MATANGENLRFSPHNNLRSVVVRNKRGKFTSKTCLKKSLDGVSLAAKGRKRSYNEPEEGEKIDCSSPRKTRLVSLILFHKNLY